MSRLDKIHASVKNALVKEGWRITDDPYKITYEDVTLYADLAAENPIAAEREGRKIVVEIKSFLGPSHMQNLKLAIGQYDIYRTLLQVTAPERELYLAIDHGVYANFFSREAIKLIVSKAQMSIVTVDVAAEEVVTWTR